MTIDAEKLDLKEDPLGLDEAFLLLGEGENIFNDDNDGLSSFFNDIKPDDTFKNNSELSDETDNFSKPYLPSVPEKNDSMKAVHMEVQENAKISTFLQPVDRSNSGRVNIYSRYTGKKKKAKTSKAKKKEMKSADVEDALPDFLKGIDFKDDAGSSSSGSFNLSEMFLGTDARPNAADAYKNAGAHGYSSSPNLLNKVPMNILSSSLIPPSKRSQNVLNSTSTGINPLHTNVQQPMRHNHSYNYYPYGRNKMLPIPSAPAPAPTKLTMKNPTSSSKTNASYGDNNSSSDKDAMKTRLVSNVPNPILGNTTLTKIPANQDHQTFPTKKGVHHNIDAKANATKRSAPSTSSLKSNSPTHRSQNKRLKNSSPAQTKDSNFIPSHNLGQQTPSKVPLTYVYRSSAAYNQNMPHYSRSSSQVLPAKSFANRSRSNSILESSPRQNQFGFGGNHRVPSVPTPPTAAFLPKPPNSNAAAIRKAVEKANKPTYRLKSKGKVGTHVTAKDLPNKAAYERKKQRAKDSRIRLNEAIEKLSLAISFSGIQSEKRENLDLGLQSSTVEIMKTCAKTSKEAKKWDRPSFIDTAATLIQNLSEQCEALEKEIIILHHKCGKTPETELSSPTLDETQPPSFESRKSPKTIKFQLEENLMDSILDCCPISVSLASFLSPISLLRCAQVSKRWAAMDIFKSDQIWANLCSKRFGEEQVLSWIKDNNEKVQSDNDTKRISIYRQMHEANVQPLCQVQGNVPLGKGKLNGVSAWASMLERSNGETVRSVLIRSSKNKNSADANNEENCVEFSSLPVVELRIVIQNTGNTNPVVLPEQDIVIDAGTRRRGEEMIELKSDTRLAKRKMYLDGSGKGDCDSKVITLKLFDSIVLVAHIHARSCPTAYKFRKKAKFTKIFVKINSITVPLLVPFEEGKIKNEDGNGDTLRKV